MAQPRRPFTAEPSSAVQKKKDTIHHHFNIQYHGPGGATCSLKVKVDQKLVCLGPNVRLHPHIHGVSFLTFADILEGFHLKPAAHILEISLIGCTDGKFEKRVITDIERKVSGIIHTFDRKDMHPMLRIDFLPRWVRDMGSEVRSIACEVEKALQHAYASFEEADRELGEIDSKIDSALTQVKRDHNCIEYLITLHETASTQTGLQSMLTKAAVFHDTFLYQWKKLCCHLWSFDVVQRAFRKWEPHHVCEWLQHTSDGYIKLSHEIRARMKWITGARLTEVNDSMLQDAGVDAETRKRILDRVRSLLSKYGGQSEDRDDEDEEDDAVDDENGDEEEQDVVKESGGAAFQSEQLDDEEEDEKTQEKNKQPRTFDGYAGRIPAAGLKTKQELQDLLQDITSTADPSHCREFTLLVIHIDDFHAFRTRELMTSLCRVFGGLQIKTPKDWKECGCDIKELHAFYRGGNQFAIVARHPSGDKARASLQSLYDVVKREIRQLHPPTRSSDAREGPLNAFIEISAGAFVGDYNKKAANGDGWLAWAIDAARKVKSLKIEALSEKMKSLELKIALCGGDAATKAKALDGRYQSAMKDPRTRWGSQVVSSLCIRDSTQSNDFRFYPTNRK